MLTPTPYESTPRPAEVAFHDAAANERQAGDAGGWMVALDVDGTLTHDGRRDVPEQTARAVAAARTAGHKVVLATGRSLVGVLPIAGKLDLAGWVVASNGAVTARLDPAAPGGYTLAARDVQALDVGPVLTAALTARLHSLQVAVEEIGWGYHVTSEFEPGLLSGQQDVVLAGELMELASPRVVLRALGVSALVGPLRAVGLTVTPVDASWLDVTPGGVSKATALETVRTRLGIPTQRTIAVGDGANDIEALVWAARGVAMGHASQAVREAADEITGTITERGVIAVLESLPAPRSLSTGELATEPITVGPA
ncbi:hydroxymethylpyrimidine pyrophosphatase-like HAD family hydrolase [Promicromonospora sp. AC04]|uniref:HAD family hydrolase n=1 Tax=Promicromonospora sp. AC04 TaxID=2135723 RepID=UPI000D4EB37C|nr:HAD family hydrolase [Promicromonospora sp. AC04]PUB20827.1 hydroxymethylpyrimidine pyrophosphatase-like HAD family hydrolase [Promicromonospora sp. AC04]